jgi:demethylmenaquinone methyltransferase/2-methoxy-6-polyprenyl-1,4-benzoquinol methylase
MEHLGRALAETRRVLRPGGHLLVLDFSVPKPPFRGLYRFYLHRVLPRIAGTITGDKAAYEYLGASIEEFPQGVKMCALMESVGLAAPTCQPLTGGVVSLYTAEKGKAPST